jgi:hypothetical protein
LERGAKVVGARVAEAVWVVKARARERERKTRDRAARVGRMWRGKRRDGRVEREVLSRQQTC